MDGVHDLGGVHGFGPVVVEPDEPPFHEPWEGRVHGMVLAAGASGALRGSGRSAIERMDPVHYLSSSYYEHWLASAETQLIAAGHLAAGELDAAVAAGRVPASRLEPGAGEFMRSLFRPLVVVDADEPAPRFGLGDRVRVRRMHPVGHTRCPRYVRGVAGAVVRVCPPSPLPDTDSGHAPEPLYSVEFAAADLWGPDAEPRATVVVDLWESYLEGAQ